MSSLPGGDASPRHRSAPAPSRPAQAALGVSLPPSGGRGDVLSPESEPQMFSPFGFTALTPTMQSSLQTLLDGHDDDPLDDVDEPPEEAAQERIHPAAASPAGRQLFHASGEEAETEHEHGESEGELHGSGSYPGSGGEASSGSVSGRRRTPTRQQQQQSSPAAATHTPAATPAHAIGASHLPIATAVPEDRTVSSKRGKIKNAFGSFKAKLSSRWSLFKKEPPSAAKVDPVTRAAAEAESSRKNSLSVPSMVASPMSDRRDSHSASHLSSGVASPATSPNPPSYAGFSASGPSTGSPVLLALPPAASAPAASSPLASASSAFPGVTPSHSAALSGQVDPRLERALADARDRAQKSALKEAQRLEKVRLDSEKALRKDQERLEKDARKREEKLIKERARLMADKKRAEERQLQEARREQERTAKVMRQMLAQAQTGMAKSAGGAAGGVNGTGTNGGSTPSGGKVVMDHLGSLAAPDLAFMHDDHHAAVSYSSAYHPNGTPLSPGRFSSVKERGGGGVTYSALQAKREPIELQTMENGIVVATLPAQAQPADGGNRADAAAVCAAAAVSRRTSLVQASPSNALASASTAASSSSSSHTDLPSPEFAPLPPASSSSSSLSHRLGFLTLHVLQGRGINGKDERDKDWKQKTAVEVTYAGCTYKSDFQPGSNPAYGLKLHLPVYDITTDVVIHFILKHSIKKNECFGMVVVPLAVMLNRQALWSDTGASASATAGGKEDIAPTPLLRRYSSNTSAPSMEEVDPTSTAVGTVVHHHRHAMASPSAASTPTAGVGSAGSPLASSSPGASASSPALPSASASASLGSRATSLVRSLFSLRSFHFVEWLQLYPYNFDHAGSLWLNRFPAAEDTILQSGMERPKKELGRVQIAMDLRLDQPLSYAYQIDPRLYEYSATALVGPHGAPLQAPQPTPSHPVLLRPEEPLDFHKTVMKKNVKRIRRWMEVPFWMEVALTVFTWKIPILTFYFLVLWSYVCFFMPAYQYPLFLVLTCFLTNVWIKRFSLEDYSYIHTYQDDAAPSSHLGEGSWKKFQRYKGVVAKISHVIGKVATQLEKTTNLLNFTDYALSIFAYLILFIFALLLSTLLYVVPAPICIWSIGFFFFARGAYHTAIEVVHEKWPDWTKRTAVDGREKSGVAASSGLIRVPGSSALDAPSPIPVPRVSTVKRFIAESQRLGLLSVKAIRFLAKSLKFLHRRAPDHYELAHRLLCERAIATSSMPPPITSLAQAKAVTPSLQARKMLFGATSFEKQQQQQQPPAGGASHTPPGGPIAISGHHSHQLADRPHPQQQQQPVQQPQPLNPMAYSFRGGMNPSHLQLNHARRRSEDGRSPPPKVATPTAIRDQQQPSSEQRSGASSSSSSSGGGAMGLTIPTSVARPSLIRAASAGPPPVALPEGSENDHDDSDDQESDESDSDAGQATAAMVSPGPPPAQWYS